MAKRVERFMSNAGGLFENEPAALQDDLRHMLAKATDSDVFAKQAAQFIRDNAAEIAAIVSAMVPPSDEPELPGLYIEDVFGRRLIPANPRDIVYGFASRDIGRLA